MEADPSRAGAQACRGGGGRPRAGTRVRCGRCRRMERGREPRPDDHDACRDEEEIEREGPCWRLNAGRGPDSLAASPRAFYTLAGAWRRRGVADAVPGCPRGQARPSSASDGRDVTGVGGRRLAPRGWRDGDGDGRRMWELGMRISAALLSKENPPFSVSFYLSFD